jgi:hypothetical protein
MPGNIGLKTYDVFSEIFIETAGSIHKWDHSQRSENPEDFRDPHGW